MESLVSKMNEKNKLREDESTTNHLEGAGSAFGSAAGSGLPSGVGLADGVDPGFAVPRFLIDLTAPLRVEVGWAAGETEGSVGGAGTLSQPEKTAMPIRAKDANDFMCIKHVPLEAPRRKTWWNRNKE